MVTAVMDMAVLATVIPIMDTMATPITGAGTIGHTGISPIVAQVVEG